MKAGLLVLFLCGALWCVSCGPQNGQSSARGGQSSDAARPSAAAVSDPCSLLTRADVEELFGSPARAPTKGSSTESGGQACSWDAPTDGPPKLTLHIDVHPTDQYLPTSPLPGYEPITVGTRAFLKAEKNVLQIDCAAGGRRVLITHSAAAGDVRERRARFVALAQKLATRLARLTGLQ